MRRHLAWACLASAWLLGGAGAASAAVYVDQFPSEDSTVVASTGVIAPGEFGYFWSVARGDSITETFGSTGLDSVEQLDLEFAVTQNVLNSGAFVDWDVLVNGNTVGSWSWSESDGVGVVNLSYSFAPIVGGGSYTIAMVVTNEVADGEGSIAIGFPGDMTLTGTAAAVPEPSSVALLGAGVVTLAGYRGWRRRKAG